MTEPDTPSPLTHEAVTALWRACFFVDATDPPDDLVRIDGVITSVPFSAQRIRNHAEQIRTLLAELPEQYRVGKGGGWTMLNMVMRRDGSFWTDSQVIAEQLVLLALAAGMARWNLPRELWHVLPSSMPYVRIDA